MANRDTHFRRALEEATGQTYGGEVGEEEGQLSPYGVSKFMYDPQEPPTLKSHAAIAGTLHGFRGNDPYSLRSAEKEVTQSIPSLRKNIPLMTAKGIAAEVIFHPMMDVIPHIDTLRKIWNPSEQIHQVFPKDEWTGKHDSYYLDGATNLERGDIYLRKSSGQSGFKLTPLVVTHEVSHLLTSPYMYGVHSNVLGGTVKINPKHEWLMAKVHTMAVEAALGTKAAQLLKKEYRNAGVDFGERGREVDPWDHIPKLEQ